MISDDKLALVVPHERQIRFQQLEFYAFIHFTVNTFTDREWGRRQRKPFDIRPDKAERGAVGKGG